MIRATRPAVASSPTVTHSSVRTQAGNSNLGLTFSCSSSAGSSGTAPSSATSRSAIPSPASSLSAATCSGCADSIDCSLRPQSPLPPRRHARPQRAPPGPGRPCLLRTRSPAPWEKRNRSARKSPTLPRDQGNSTRPSTRSSRRPRREVPHRPAHGTPSCSSWNSRGKSSSCGRSDSGFSPFGSLTIPLPAKTFAFQSRPSNTHTHYSWPYACLPPESGKTGRSFIPPPRKVENGRLG